MKTGVSGAVRWLCGALSGALLVLGAVHAQPPARIDPLEQRVQLLARELDLNAEQQQAVRGILRSQREAVKQIWQDPAIAPAERAPAVRLLGEQTADRIRAVFSADQKKKYNRPLPEAALSTQANVDVEGWLRAARGQSRRILSGYRCPPRKHHHEGMRHDKTFNSAVAILCYRLWFADGRYRTCGTLDTYWPQGAPGCRQEKQSGPLTLRARCRGAFCRADPG